MARKKVVVKSALNSWDEVNEVLRQIAEKQSYVDQVVARYNEAEAKRRKALDEAVNPIKNEIANLENEIRLFCEENKDEFEKRKSREMANGVVGFRLGTPKAKSLKGFTWKAVLEIIKRTPFKKQYIRIKEDVNKEQIIQDFTTKKVDAETLRSLGVEVVQDETFWYEVKTASDADAA